MGAHLQAPDVARRLANRVEGLIDRAWRHRRRRHRRRALAVALAGMALAAGAAAYRSVPPSPSPVPGPAAGGSHGSANGSPSGGPAPIVTAASVTPDPLTLDHLVPPGTIVDGRVRQPISLDNGALVIDPAPSTESPHVSLKKAISIAEAARTVDQGVFEANAVGFGIVHLRAKLTKRLPSYRDRAAWIGILGPEMATACPPPSTTDASPLVDVVLIDARTAGAVLDYRSGGYPCTTGLFPGDVLKPKVRRADEILSLRWKAVKTTPLTAKERQIATRTAGDRTRPLVNWVVRFTLPPCGTQFDSGVYQLGPKTTSPTLYIDTTVPIAAPSSCHGATTVTETWGPEAVPVSRALHAPVGLARGAEL